ncbi:WGR domain-containing protein [Rhizobium alvei]|uniref:WGR domain-containing protein n=1 Tax=Rhizobium alvei TaxID=1132659 RepID=A0ABT8YQY0_9HYPH|nr:WGR domain-containing protein [Rhizobium alvei]MDO6966029.1 WGR domain-containing protein [Rhizobium alvei]
MTYQDLTKPILISRVDTARNMARFYEIEVGYDLFCNPVLIRRWGRIGTNGQMKIDVAASLNEAEEAGRSLLARKLGRGYLVR